MAAKRVTDPFLKAVIQAMIERRKELGISQAKLSQICGLHRTFICEIERGMHVPTIRTLKTMIDGLQMPLSQLCEIAEKRVEVKKLKLVEPLVEQLDNAVLQSLQK